MRSVITGASGVSMLSTSEQNPQFIRYSARLAVPEHMTFLESWTERSQVFRTQQRPRRIQFGDSEHQAYEYFETLNVKGGPTLVFYHGGYWQALYAVDFSFIAEAFTNAGINVIIVDYDLCPTVSMLDIQEQILHSFVSIVKSSAKLGFDSHKLILSGHSAGGQMIASILCEDWSAYGLSSDHFTISLALSISGLFDLRPLVGTLINQALAMPEDMAWYLSPLRRKPRLDVPLLLWVGADETDGFLEQSDWLLAEWSEFLTEIERIRIPGHHHFSIVDAFAHAKHPVFETLLERVQVADVLEGKIKDEVDSPVI